MSVPENAEELAPLRARIMTAKEESGLSLNALTVLDDESDPYRQDTPARRRDAWWFAEQVANASPYGTIHLRSLHYRLLGVRLPDGTPYLNTDKIWEWLGHASTAARWLGYVPFARIHDERNDPPIIHSEDFTKSNSNIGIGDVHGGSFTVQPASLLGSPPWVSTWVPTPQQPFRLIFIGEKSSMYPELAPVAEQVKGELILTTGEPSITLVVDLAKRAADDGRPAVVLYFADFDPAGWQMPVSVARKLQALCDRRHPDLEISVYRAALKLNQVRQFDLPSKPLKNTECRADRWKAEFNREQTELDALLALHPGTLRRIAEGATKPFFDDALKTRAWTEAMKWRQKAERQISDSPTYAEAQDIIYKANEEVESFNVRLSEELSRYQRLLEQANLNLPDLHAVFHAVEPQLEVTAPTPLFSSADDFITATQKLREQKRFVDGDGQ